jgi:glyoxylase-like metal-dependent hydrolase (beta-lactamase superfamily II)
VLDNLSMAHTSTPEAVAPDVFLVRDTCNVYVLRAGTSAVLIDFGSGGVLQHLASLGVERVTDVLVTHHHRDQVQGLDDAAAAGARIWVPPVERDLISAVDRHWLRRPMDNDYDLRQDRFSLLRSVPVTGTVSEYRSRRYGEFEIFTLPTPGHTVGSVSYLVDVGGTRVAFTGDLIYGAGKVWSLAATQWTYTGVEGQAATIISAGVLRDHRPQVLLPSHGRPIEEPGPAISQLRRRLQELLDMRSGLSWDLDDWVRRPWEQLMPHLLCNRSSLATTWALLSESGSALLIDFGYDMTTGFAPGSDRSARRPLLTSLASLRRDFGIERIEVAVPTHYHDDHVAGLNLLRDVEATEIWIPHNVEPVLREPWRHDLPCLWYDPVSADRILAPEAAVDWREYQLTAYPLAGHSLYAAAILFEADGHRMLAVGDQETDSPNPLAPDTLNYQYRNRFRYDDFTRSAELCLALEPDIMLFGHRPARAMDDAYLRRQLEDGKRIADLHRALLPLEDFDFGAEGFGARIEPYRSTVREGETLDLEISVRNPFARAETALVRFVVPLGWSAEPFEQSVELPPHAEATVPFRIAPHDAHPIARARIAADLTVGGVRFGQQAEALVNVE